MIEENVKKIIEELPPGVQLVAAAKTRTPEENPEKRLKQESKLSGRTMSRKLLPLLTWSDTE